VIFQFCCYLSDWPWMKAFQKQGIGKTLIDETHKVAGLQTMLILLAAPAAASVLSENSNGAIYRLFYHSEKDRLMSKFNITEKDRDHSSSQTRRVR
jgi:hypothetical protein